MRKSRFVRGLGLGILTLGAAAFVARPALSEPPNNALTNHVHAPHPQLHEGQNAQPPHVAHKPHPQINPNANPEIALHAHKPHPTLNAVPALPTKHAHKPHPSFQPQPAPPPDINGIHQHAPHSGPIPIVSTHVPHAPHAPHKQP
jgi:hypothetical protein